MPDAWKNRPVSGQLWVGTSGFSYADWYPCFYPAGLRPSQLLAAYAARLPAVELNNTFYQQPPADRVAAWLAQTPATFRFVVKAQRGASIRAFREPERAETVSWLTDPYRLFGQRLGAVLFRVPAELQRDDARLAALLAAWPDELPLAVELQHPSWYDDEVLALLRRRGAALCATETDDSPRPPDLRLTGSWLYVRLRRSSYTAAELAAWAERLTPFLADGRDCFVFFRHDEVGESPLRALALQAAVARLLAGRNDAEVAAPLAEIEAQ